MSEIRKGESTIPFSDARRLLLAAGYSRPAALWDNGRLVMYARDADAVVVVGSSGCPIVYDLTSGRRITRAKNSKSPEDLRAYADDHNRLVREAVAGNRHTPRDVIERLAAAATSERHRAQEELARRDQAENRNGDTGR